MNAAAGATYIPSPIVNADPQSPESKLARQAAQIAAQVHADSKYDDKTLAIEAFADYANHRSRNLAYGALVSAGFLSAVVIAHRFMTK
jgi:hypothetical protein